MAGWNLHRIRLLAGLTGGLPSGPGKMAPAVFFTASWTGAWSVRHNHSEFGCYSRGR